MEKTSIRPSQGHHSQYNNFKLILLCLRLHSPLATRFLTHNLGVRVDLVGFLYPRHISHLGQFCIREFDSRAFNGSPQVLLHLFMGDLRRGRQFNN